MSDTPKKILFIMMNVSARPLVKASSVAFMDSEDIYTQPNTVTGQK